MKTYFQKALPIWAKGHEHELNSSLFFKTLVEEKTFDMVIAANNFYRVYVDGNFFGYGPSRDAHDYYRVDKLHFHSKKKGHVIVIEVSGYNCNSFYALNRSPFLQCEILSKNKVIKATGFDFDVFHNDTRIREVTRFSYQRAFSESYILTNDFNSFLKTERNPYTKLEPQVMEAKRFEDRIVHYPIYPKIKFLVKEAGDAFINENKKVYEDRYQVLDYLKIFPKDSWKIDSNKIASQLDFRLSKQTNPLLEKGRFLTFGTKASVTGFLDLEIEVKEEALLYILFDEVDIRDENHPDLIGICFYRNTTHNCVTYSLKKGKYHLVSFEPYTLLNARIVCLEGSARISRFGVIAYENPDTCGFRYHFKDDRINTIFDAAVNTFKQNAVDLLTDCPSRERAGWLCDSYWSGAAEPLITGNNIVEKAFLDAYAKCDKSNLPDGMIPMCYPADFPSNEYIPNWALWYILELYRYKERNYDSSLIKKSENNIRGILRYFSRFENELGLLENLTGWVFVEWSKANDEEFIKGINFPSNMLYAEALVKAGLLLKDKTLVHQGENLKRLIRELSFNGEFFVDNAVRDANHHINRTNNITETCQYYALYFGIIRKEDDPLFFEKMIKNFGEYRDDKTVYPYVYKSNLLMGIMMRLSLLNRYGLNGLVFKETIEYFLKMAKMTGTLWEHDSVFASLNHCFTSYIIHIFLDANFGLEKIDDKKKILFLRKNALHEEGECIIPLGNKKLFLKAKDKQLKIRKPIGYSIRWK